MDKNTRAKTNTDSLIIYLTNINHQSIKMNMKKLQIKQEKILKKIKQEKIL